MSSINKVGTTSPISKIAPKPVKPTTDTSATTPTRGNDKVELSGVSHYLSTLKTNDIRHDKVADIKKQIAAGTYETEDKIDGAVDKLLSDL